jgi:hypothetical protein
MGNLVVHIVFMVLGALLLFIAGLIGSTDKGEAKINLHRGLGVTGIIVIILGVIGLLSTKSFIITLPHFYLAILAIIFLLLTPVGGLLYMKADTSKKLTLRKFHRVDAIIFFMIILLTALFGIIGIKALS